METIFLWSAPRIVPERWSVSDRIQKVIQYMEQHLIPFLDQT